MSDVHQDLLDAVDDYAFALTSVALANALYLESGKGAASEEYKAVRDAGTRQADRLHKLERAAVAYTKYKHGSALEPPHSIDTSALANAVAAKSALKPFTVIILWPDEQAMFFDTSAEAQQFIEQQAPKIEMVLCRVVRCARGGGK